MPEPVSAHPNVYLDKVQDSVIGGIPDECRTGGEGYFVTSGPVEG